MNDVPAPCRAQRPHDAAPPRDSGSALVITLMVMAIVTVLATTVLTATVNNVSSSRRSLDAASALDAADAGVTQALAYLRKEGPSELDCSPTCAANPWGKSSAPYTRTIPGSTRQSYAVWIEEVPATDPAVFRIHSHGMSTKGSRYVQVDAALIPGMNRLPLGVFARSIEGGGSASVTRESIFSTGCVYNRSKIEMGTSMDAAYGIRAAVHSARIITDKNGNTATCSVDNSAIHKTQTCHASYPYDQDSLGGPMASKPNCPDVSSTEYAKYYSGRDLDGNAANGNDVDGSFLRDAASLMKVFNITDEPLTSDELDDLRTVAKSQGNYRNSAAVGLSPDPATTPNAVLFFDLTAATGSHEVDLNDIEGWGRPLNLSATDDSCPTRSLLIIIVDGNAKLNSNQQLAASLVLTGDAPYGQITKANGTANFIGTVFADHVNLVGNVDISMDQCFLANLPPGLFSIEVQSYRELDR